TSYVASIDPELYGATLEKFRREPSRYREVYARDRCHLFEFHGEAGAAAEAGTAVLSARVDAPPAGSRRVGRLFPNGVRLESAALSPDTVCAGGTLVLTCCWTKEHDADDPLPYKVYLRLARPADAGARAWSKWARKAEEIRKGRLSRARTMRNLLRGAYPPADWPKGVLIEDTIRWPLPADLEAGVYDFEVTLRRSSLVRNYYLSDFVSERDSFSGAAAGRVVVRPAAEDPARAPEERTSGGGRGVPSRNGRHPVSPESRNQAKSRPGIFANENGGERPAA
ncbi:MAG: hypothetical protein ABIH26_04295, partial [Candidatus Eisenbacteria bacterium]